jgi:hypothetical protein
MHNRWTLFKTTALAIASLLTATAAYGQAAGERRLYVAVKAGGSIERAEDNLHGSVPAGGFAIGIPLASSWTVEVEVWVPGFITSGPEIAGIKHRDILVNGAVARRFTAGRLTPFVLFGLGVSQTQDRFNTCTAVRRRFDTGELETVVVSCTEPDILSRNEERFDGGGLFALGGLGLEVPLTRRVRVVPDVRVNAMVGSVIIRPSIALQISF